MSVIDTRADVSGYTFAPKVIMTSGDDSEVGMTQAEMMRRLVECLSLYDRVIHPVADDPARRSIEDLLIDVSSCDPSSNALRRS